jgi:hypothetical protein
MVAHQRPDDPPRSLTPILSYGRPGIEQVRRPPGPPVLRVLMTGLVLLIAVLLIAYPIARLLPYGWHVVTGVPVPTMRMNKYNRPAVFYIGTYGTGRWTGTSMKSAYVTYTGESQAGAMHVELPAMSYRLNLYRNEQAHVPGHSLSRDAVLDYVEKAGFDRASTEAGTIADRLLSELQGLAAGRVAPDASRYGMAGVNAIDLGEFGHLLWIPWYTPFCLPFWILAWWAAGRQLVRRYHRRLLALNTQSGTVGAASGHAGSAAVRE